VLENDVDQAFFLWPGLGSTISDEADDDKGSGQGLSRQSCQTSADLRRRTPGKVSILRVSGQLMGVNEVDPQYDVLVEAPDDMNWVFDHSVSDMEAKIVDS